MKLPGSTPDDCRRDRALSPIVGAALLLGVVFAVTAVLAAFIFGASPGLQSDRPVAQFDIDYNASNDSIDITQTRGKSLYGGRLYIEDETGNRSSWLDYHPKNKSATPGATIQIGTQRDRLAWPCAQREGHVYTVVYYSPAGERQVLQQYSFPGDNNGCP
jgi:flagellin-like protein